jgi:hypothetical protein
MDMTFTWLDCHISVAARCCHFYARQCSSNSSHSHGHTVPPQMLAIQVPRSSCLKVSTQLTHLNVRQC